MLFDKGTPTFATNETLHSKELIVQYCLVTAYGRLNALLDKINAKLMPGRKEVPLTIVRAKAVCSHGFDFPFP